MLDITYFIDVMYIYDLYDLFMNLLYVTEKKKTNTRNMWKNNPNNTKGKNIYRLQQGLRNKVIELRYNRLQKYP